jgi:hypothetical protein
VREDTIKECINTIRGLWYEENNTPTEGMDIRQIGMHVGKKSAYIQCMNKLLDMIDDKEV